MDVTSFISAVLAGGLAGQVTSVVLAQRLQGRREKDAWLRDARLRAFSEMLEHTSSYANRSDFESWPTEIRILSQKVQLLCPGGEAPALLAAAMQKAFILALLRKQDRVKDVKSWRDSFRQVTSALRREFALLLHGVSRDAPVVAAPPETTDMDEDRHLLTGDEALMLRGAVEPGVVVDGASPRR